MKIDRIEEILNEICPPELAEEWDNSGLQLGFKDLDVKKILVALEVTEDVIEEAIKESCDLIVTHHPLFFGSFNQINEEVLPTKYAIKLIKSGIGVYSCHTNFDILPGGNNDYIGNLLGIYILGEKGFIRYGEMEKEMPLKDFINHIGEKLSLDKDSFRLIGAGHGNDLNERKIKRVAWCTGAGADFIMDAFDINVEIYITGDVRYHEARTIEELGFCCLDIGHFGSEKIFTENMANILTDYFKNGLKDDDKSEAVPEIIASRMDKDPFVIPRD